MGAKLKVYDVSSNLLAKKNDVKVVATNKQDARQAAIDYLRSVKGIDISHDIIIVKESHKVLNGIVL